MTDVFELLYLVFFVTFGFFPLSIPLVLILAFGLNIGVRHARLMPTVFPRRFYAYIFVVILIQTIITFLSFSFRNTDDFFGQTIIFALAAFVAFLAVLVVYKEKGRRILVATIAFPLLVLTGWFTFFAWLLIIGEAIGVS